MQVDFDVKKRIFRITTGQFGPFQDANQMAKALGRVALQLSKFDPLARIKERKVKK